MLRSGVATYSSLSKSSDSAPSTVELGWEQWGADGGHPLLMINGLGSPMVSYEVGLIERFVDAGFQVVRFDNRDAGRSTKSDVVAGEASYRVADMAQDAVAVLDAVGWDQAHVWGQSMGGMIAQQVAIDHGSRMSSLISVMSTTGERGFGTPSKEARVALVRTQPEGREAWIEDRIVTEKLWASPAFYDPATSRRKSELMFDYGISQIGTAQQYRAVVASGSRDVALASLDMPTLVIHGSADNLISPDGGQHTADVIPGARYVQIEGFGHDLPAELWPRLVQEVADFAL